MFSPGRPLLPSLMSAGKARSVLFLGRLRLYLQTLDQAVKA
jgi:hypothetical protein